MKVSIIFMGFWKNSKINFWIIWFSHENMVHKWCGPLLCWFCLNSTFVAIANYFGWIFPLITQNSLWRIWDSLSASTCRSDDITSQNAFNNCWMNIINVFPFKPFCSEVCQCCLISQAIYRRSNQKDRGLSTCPSGPPDIRGEMNHRHTCHGVNP